MNSGNKASYNNKTYASVFARQPPRILIVDVTPPLWLDTCTNLCEALENFFSLACSLAGPCRVPLLSLYVVHNQQECLLPFVQVKGNFARLHSCVTELRTMPKEGCIRQKPDSLTHAIEDGVLQFKQYMRHVTVGGSLNSCSVEITVLTSQSGRHVVKQLESGLSSTDLVSLRRVQVIHISKGNPLMMTDMDWSPQALSGEGGEMDENAILGTDIDLQSVENNAVCLESFFKAWLHDHSSDKEHLHLLLPPGGFTDKSSPSSNSVNRQIGLCLKCDVQERLLSPTLLPGAADFTVKTESVRDFEQAHKTPANLYRLRVLKALKSNGVCESVFFGLPLIIRPTNCWQLDWDELESNHQNFQALCHTLRNRDWLLLARCEPQTQGPSWRVTVYSYYVIQPSASLTLLMKPVAVRELLLPCHLPVVDEEPPETALSRIQSSLDVLDVDPAYNPLALKSNLYKHLRGLLGRTPYRQQTQRREQRPPEQPPHRQNPQQSRQHQSKVKATVAPLPSASSKSFRPALTMNSSYDLTFCSDEEEFLTGL
ncbi:meiosis 1 arrest protein [Huso huso]|uniref:Meiosis 1 arrest protein n=1 Tax=Huso huso TaxID=61971 RepID=A0ABR1A8I6_HUSHU